MKRFFSRLFLRLVYWAEKPLPHEEIMLYFYMGKNHEHREMLKKYPIIEVKPYPYNTMKPLGIRQRAIIRKLRLHALSIPEERGADILASVLEDTVTDIKTVQDLYRRKGYKTR